MGTTDQGQSLKWSIRNVHRDIHCACTRPGETESCGQEIAAPQAEVQSEPDGNRHLEYAPHEGGDHVREDIRHHVTELMKTEIDATEQRHPALLNKGKIPDRRAADHTRGVSPESFPGVHPTVSACPPRI